MKKFKLLFQVTGILLALFMSACNLPSNGTSPKVTVSTTVPNQPTQGSTGIPSAVSTQTAAPTKPSPTGCGNPYFPDSPGSTWTYANTSNQAGAPSTTVRTLSKSLSGVYVIDNTTPDIQVTVHWDCKDGNMTMLQAATISTKGLIASLKAESADGYLIPAVISAGQTWSEKLSIQTSGATTGANPTTVEQQNDTQIDCTANGKESVQVTAGKFDAVKVTCKYTITTLTTINGQAGKAVTNTLDVTDWYAPGVGLVKGVQTGDIESVQELTSYKIQ